MGKNIGYHTRLWGNGEKVTGGSFGGQIDQQTVERLVKAHFTVAVKQSGSATFVDKSGREVRLYICVDPESTEQGRIVMEARRKAEAARLRAEEELSEVRAAEIESAMEGLSHEEIMRRLKG